VIIVFNKKFHYKANFYIMDPISAAGIALSVASLAGQVFTGCIQGL
jgi:hypothetical protein